jgi:putative inorganic carbon (hco3(-)) transporter
MTADAPAGASFGAGSPRAHAFRVPVPGVPPPERESGRRLRSTLAGTTVMGIATVVLVIAAVVGGLIAGAPIIVLAGAVGLAGAVAVVLHPDVATLAAIGLVYSNAAVVLSKFHNVPVVVAAVVPLLMLVPIARDLVARRENVVVSPALPWLLAYTAASLVSGATSSDPSGTIGDLVTLATEGVLLYTLVTNAVRTSGMLRLATWLLLVVAAGLAGLSLIQQVTHNYSNDFFGFAQVSQYTLTSNALNGDVVTQRLAGPIGEENRYAQVLLTVLPLGLLRAWAERSRLLSFAAVGLSALVGIGVALTFSRGAAVAFGVVVLCLVPLGYLRLRYLVATALLVVAVLVAVPGYAARVGSLNVFADLLSGNTTSQADTSILSRATENVAAALVFADHPILGVGPGMFPAYYYTYAQDVGILTRTAQREAHNLYLHVLAETGIIGFIAFAGLVLVTLREVLRARRRALARRRSDLAALATGALLSIVAYLTTGMFLHLSFARYFWLVMAIAASTAMVVFHELDAPEAEVATASVRPPDRREPHEPPLAVV